MSSLSSLASYLFAKNLLSDEHELHTSIDAYNSNAIKVIYISASRKFFMYVCMYALNAHPFNIQKGI